ncbi:hypothetical protein [Aliihoeflea sp. 40Bstr573]|nr:hypothetical protein [Aliihoeflea sp. 40Bstr573]
MEALLVKGANLRAVTGQSAKAAVLMARTAIPPWRISATATLWNAPAK